MRASLTPIARYCPLAAKLASEHPGAGLSALMGSAFHAMAADLPDAKERFDRLPRKEQDEIASWYKPADVELHGNREQAEASVPPSIDRGWLRFNECRHEVPMGISRAGVSCPHDSPFAALNGTADMVWVRGSVVYIGDIKRSIRTVSAGPDSLQLLTYGFMAAAAEGSRYFCPGIWGAEEGEWIWGRLYDPFEEDEVWDTLLATAKNVGSEPVIGSHCLDCYQRRHCPEWVLDPEVAPSLVATALDNMTDDSGVLEALRVVERAEEAAEAGKQRVRAWIKENRPRGLRDGAGKIYRPLKTSGRSSLDVKALRASVGDATVDQHMKKGTPYDAWRWVKE